jgi:hypothetical protein
MKVEFSGHICENTQISNFIKIRVVKAELFHADGQTDMTLLTVVFRNFLNVPKNCQTKILHHTHHKALSMMDMFHIIGCN